MRFAGPSPLRRQARGAGDRRRRGRLNGTGRLLIRESGTEPLIRVMAEGDDEAAGQPQWSMQLCETDRAATPVREDRA